jgi:hypothetical protein
MLYWLLVARNAFRFGLVVAVGLVAVLALNLAVFSGKGESRPAVVKVLQSRLQGIKAAPLVVGVTPGAVAGTIQSPMGAGFIFELVGNIFVAGNA